MLYHSVCRMRLALPWPCYISLHNAMLIVCSFFLLCDNQMHGQNNIRYGIWSVRFRFIAIICPQHSNRLHFQSKQIDITWKFLSFIIFCALFDRALDSSCFATCITDSIGKELHHLQWIQPKTGSHNFWNCRKCRKRVRDWEKDHALLLFLPCEKRNENIR